MKYLKYGFKINVSEADVFAKACLENSEQLVLDAKLLLKHKRYARAYSISILALEELAKFSLIFNIRFSKKWDDKKWKEFWKNIHDHKIKQRKWHRVGFLKANSVNPIRLSKTDIYSMDGLKQFGLYVGYFDDQLLLPEKVFKRSKKRIEKIIKFTEHEIKDALSQEIPTEDEANSFLNLMKNLEDGIEKGLSNSDIDIESALQGLVDLGRRRAIKRNGKATVKLTRDFSSLMWRVYDELK